MCYFSSRKTKSRLFLTFRISLQPHNHKLSMDHVQTFLILELSQTSWKLVSLVLICSALFILIQKWKNRHLVRLASQFPGPTSLPIIGNALEFANTDHEQFLAAVLKLGRRYESPFRLWLGSKLCVFITKPDDLQIVLNSSKMLGKDEVYKFLAGSAGSGLFTAPVEKWKKTRKAIAPAFNSIVLDQFLPIMNERGAVLVQEIQCHCRSGDEIDIFPYINCMALDTICQTFIGVQLNTQLDQKIDFAAALARSLELQVFRMYTPWLHFDFIFDRTSYAKELDEAIKTIKGYTEKVIQQRKKEYDEAKILISESDDINSEKGKKSKDFVDILFARSDQGIVKFSETDITDEVLTIMAAGSETSALTSCFCLLLLAMHPEIQNKVFEEQYGIFGNENGPVTPEDLTKMKYTEQVLKETLRLISTAPFILRAVEEDTKITGGLVLPAGATAVISPLLTHTDPGLWPEPQKFNPDNFSDVNWEKKHKYSFIPFSGGPRGCIGMKYAMMSMKTTISIFIRHYEVTTMTKLEDIKLCMDVLVRSSNGWNMKLEPRKYPDL